jgi:hypothetical protein
MSCIICGEDLKNKYSIKLECNCNYEYHYECISSTLKHDKSNKCPYCSKPFIYLPLVNGLKKIDKKIHKIDENNSYENIMCKSILKSGKNKGNECGKYCKLGYFQCNRHFKQES